MSWDLIIQQKTGGKAVEKAQKAMKLFLDKIVSGQEILKGAYWGYPGDMF